MSWPPPPPPSSLNAEQLDEALATMAQATVQMVTDLLKEKGADHIINTFTGPKQLLRELLPNPSELIFDLTRPGVVRHNLDLLPRVREAADFDVDKYLAEFDQTYYVDAAGKPLMSYTHVSSIIQRDEMPPNVTETLHKVVTDFHDALGFTKGEFVDMSAEVSKRFGKAEQKAQDKQVEEFRGKLDDIFATWEGGET